MGLNVVLGSAQHVGSRKDQQDAYGSCDLGQGGWIAVIADGMGGLEHGDAASSTAVQTVLQICRTAAAPASAPDLLLHAVHAANEAVKAAAQRLGSPGDIGTTIVVTCVKESELFWAAVGDSALFLFRENALTQLNTAHVYANRLSGEQALTHPDRESLTSYLGIESLTEVDRNVQPFRLQAGDRLLLMSDGIFKVLNTTEICGVIRGNAQQISDDLVHETIAKGAQYQDNATVLTLSMTEETVPPLEPKKRGSVSIFAAGIVLLAVGTGVVWRYLGPKKPSPDTGPQVLTNLAPKPDVKPATAAEPPSGVTAQGLGSAEDAGKAEHTSAGELK